ncbi:hypothetical protein ACUY3K_00095 [Corynebacterium uberis]|uniref:hypothetical protein n=1 Tax=Corynebacterium TaxID=1716 RepID=UPI001D09B6BF|nr:MULTISPECIES: hypothetical protein [Corynebacterium]MCZ9309165.1 hypothetical protein [Corynebacterium sp. c6VSa_13]UDL74376.1 hypothetical protein LH391_04035 [Corynebacterium uberis]UDL76790.1 hypothetical protein LH393_05360 [Corynebacterium uberis]UDL79003.1 hypothetical protein LH394_05350 [Corynebacterium uberis]UDL81280.1 hypothetical protein LH392_05770 [Corynebacterium uberis]
MTGAEMATAIFHVAALGLVFGAGIPALFALGMRCLAGDVHHNPDGSVVRVHEASPAMKLLGYLVFAFCAALLIFAVAWTAKETLLYYFGFNLLGMA